MVIYLFLADYFLDWTLFNLYLVDLPSSKFVLYLSHFRNSCLIDWLAGDSVPSRHRELSRHPRDVASTLQHLPCHAVALLLLLLTAR